MGGDNLDCPTCATLVEPKFGTASAGKRHYMDSKFYVTCDICGLDMSTNAYRATLAKRPYYGYLHAIKMAEELLAKEGIVRDEEE
jgi:hypothetical protein